MQREVATSPIEYTLDHLCELASLRLHKLEPRHPLRLRTKKAYYSPHPTRLEKLAQLCPTTTQYSNSLLDSCQWVTHLFGGSHKCLNATGGSRDKKKAADNFNSWRNSLDKNDIVVYTDGSQKVDKTGKILGTGSAWILRWKDRWLGMNGFSLGSKAEVYDAEILRLCGGLEAALTSPMVGVISGIHVCIDNLSVAQKAGSIPNGSSQAGFARFQEAARHWIWQGSRITVQWVPSHMGIKGNEKADMEAKKHAEIVVTAGTEETQTLAHACRAIREKKDQAWQKE